MQIDIIQLLKDYNIKMNNDVPGWVNVDCPICLHQGTRGYKGGFNIAGGYFNCWSCGGHKLSFVIKKLLNISIYDAEEVIERYSGRVSVLNKINKKIVKPSKIDLPGDSPIDKRYRKYLFSRNFDPAYIEQKYKIRSGGIVGDEAFRIIIPIYFNGQLISYQTRSIFNKRKCKELGILRYQTLSKELSVIDPKNILYEIDNCKGTKLILVEGVTDQWRLGDGVCATLGTSMTEKQIELISNRFKQVIFLYDPEDEAQKRAKKQAERIAELGLDVEIFDTEFFHDPGDMTEKEVYKIKKELGI